MRPFIVFVGRLDIEVSRPEDLENNANVGAYCICLENE